MAKKRRNNIPPESDDEVQIVYEKQEDMEVWYHNTKKRKVSKTFLKSNLFGCGTCLAKQLLANIESMKH